MELIKVLTKWCRRVCSKDLLTFNRKRHIHKRVLCWCCQTHLQPVQERKERPEERKREEESHNRGNKWEMRVNWRNQEKKKKKSNQSQEVEREVDLGDYLATNSGSIITMLQSWLENSSTGISSRRSLLRNACAAAAAVTLTSPSHSGLMTYSTHAPFISVYLLLLL